MFGPQEQASWGPPVLPPSPTLEQVAAVVNGNSARIGSFVASQATISGPGFPTLGAEVVFERPKRLRIRGGTALSGAELDLGENDEVLWLWVRRNEPPAMYFCRRDQYAVSQAGRMIPVDPDWLVEALGITEIDLAAPNQGPVSLAGGGLEIRTARQSPDGPTTKVIVIDASRGLVLGQHVYDSRGQLLASAVLSNHRRDPVSGLVLPRVVDIACPRVDLRMRISLGNAAINQPVGNPAEVWTMPTYPGYALVDLAAPSGQAVPAGAAASVSCQPCAPCGGWH